MNNIKKYWKEILIALLVIFGMNKCTTSCTRGTKIKKQNNELIQKDSIIKVQKDSLNILKIRWSDAQNSQDTYKGIAMGNQQELIKELTIVKNENLNLQNKINKLETENIKLKKDINHFKSLQN